MRILLFGPNGQVGSELRSLPWGDGLELIPVGRNDADLSADDAAAAAIHREKPDLVVNAAAYTAVDKAESEPDLAKAVNADAPGGMARACADLGIPFIHISTDFVFDGTKSQPYDEEDPTGPVSVYGQSKLEGEEAVRAAHADHLILRTAWVFSPYGNNFLKTMLRLGAERDELGIVDDQRGCPTSAAGIACAIRIVIDRLKAGEPMQPGTYHYCGDEPVTWFGFASAIFEAAAGRLPGGVKVKPIGTSDYPTPARRPANSVMSCAKIRAVYGIEPDDWRREVSRIVDRLLSESSKTGE
ncbi:dTDP-4-dehydrorhamnose reductase [Hwanghaeella grinnelliae]|uniref:dTDP-4-dehydrorhamnose reductase n=1 Tax=Hwanghaeella grinnelliae TaxID=2500179 RepID=A0A3S2VMU8_9PROT|nr:dTDP-4-dehydrorhamnose reductase [Hwanghaeella grinnelliae]RVU34093.1 dTDP-4-dehydrorhamnose reductase [Hwanghaeella grinnelliae]